MVKGSKQTKAPKTQGPGAHMMSEAEMQKAMKGGQMPAQRMMKGK